ncbi:MAG TPA: arylsulfatase [Opitutae bacterium]|nr:arylsulfatase [Opitutae bacterium]|tara:strand:- start:1952 stop:3373 length:1422 start_codon:yes stop_codon:yes gene_type:complete
MKITLWSLVLPCLLILAFLQAQAKQGKRPNVVVVLCDDLGYGDLACYGHPKIKTPHLDRMAEGGIRFTDFYSSAPVCSPSRVGLLTGRSPNRAGVYDWIPGGRGVHMRTSEVTIPHLLKKAGYATCMSGKWHCNGKFNSPQQPQPDAAGFDHWFGTQNNASPSHENPKNFVRNGKVVGPLKGFSCQLVMDEALGWLKKQQARDAEQPFFLYVAFHEPHEPVASPKEMVNQYDGVAKNLNQAQYFANVTNVDAAVGKLMKTLKSMKLDENTLVVFTSDNGPETLLRYGPRSGRSFGVADPLRGMKLWTTEAGFRVAGIMRWPARIEPGQVSGRVVSALDFLPTFCELAGTKPPKDLALDGTSFLPALEDKPVKREKPLVWVYYNALNNRRVAMRDGQWKVLAKLSIGKLKTIDSRNADQVKGATLSDFQVFDLSQDVGEKEDLAKANPVKLAELKKKLQTHYRELVEGSHVWGK